MKNNWKDGPINENVIGKIRSSVSEVYRIT